MGDELSIEELLALANSEEKSLHRELNEAEKFCSMNNIGPGHFKVKFKEIYRAYIMFAKEPINKTVFSRQLAKIAKSVRDGKGRYYMINRKNINEETEE